MKEIVEDHDVQQKRLLYQVIVDDVTKDIHDGVFTFDRPFCTERQLMDKYSVSRITARRAISELEKQGILYSKRGVGSFVCRDVYKTKHESSNSPGGMFAFVLPFDMAGKRIFDTFQRMNAYLMERGCHASVYTLNNLSDPEDREGRRVIQQLLDMNVSGVAFYPSVYTHHDLLEKFVLSGKSAVLLDRRSNCPYVPDVVSDNVEGSRLLAEHLISLGHRRIAFVTATKPERCSSVMERRTGYVKAHMQAGISVDTALTQYELTMDFSQSNEVRYKNLHAEIRRLLDLNVTAIMAEHDQMACYMLLCCRDMGIAVPEQLSICGFDADQWSTLVYQSTGRGRITTIFQDQETIGTRVGELLYEGSREGLRFCGTTVVPVSFIPGDTTGPVPD